MILKLQRSLFPTNKLLLVYNKDQTVFGQMELANDVRDLFLEANTNKLYVEGILQSDGKGENTLIIYEVIEDQDW